MYSMVQDTKLKQLRDSLGATQEQVVRRTKSLTIRTYVRAEDGEAVTNRTATQILEAVNLLRSEKGEAPLTLGELGLTLY